jgi:hypothetical protein
MSYRIPSKFSKTDVLDVLGFIVVMNLIAFADNSFWAGALVALTALKWNRWITQPLVKITNKFAKDQYSKVGGIDKATEV